MNTPAVTPDASAATKMEHALETGFLPEDPHYRKTGQFADTEAAPAAATEEKPPAKEEAPAASDAEPAAASAAAEPQEKPGKTAATSESRWAKITRENRELRDRLARLEAAPPQRETQQAPQPAAEAKPPIPGLVEPQVGDKNPDGSWKYKTHEDYLSAVRKYDREYLKAELRQDNEKTLREQQQAQAERTIAESMVKKFEGTRAKYTDFEQVAFNPDLLIPKYSVTDVFLLESDHAGEVLYYLGQHPEITQSFYGDHDVKTGKFTNKMTPPRQFRKLMEIETEVSKPAPAPKITQASRPPHQVSGKGTVAKDAVEQAVEDNDTEAYIRVQNERELARRKRK
jgi:hypothetical protein